MKIHSIKFKITLLLVVTVTCLVAMLIGFNSIFSEKVYMNRKQKSMINSYENVNEIMQKYTDSQIDKDTMCADMENISTAKGISVLVVDSSWCTIYVSTQGDDSMMERLRMSIFNGDIFKNNGSQDKAPEPKDQEDDSDNPADKDDKKEHRKRLEDIIDMSGTSLVENRTIISSNDNYTLQKVYDERLGDYYLEIWGTLDNGYSIILRTPIQGIKDNVNISTTLIKYVGGAILAVGIIAAFVVSTYITRPIKQLSNIAEKMSEMDFNARYEGSDKGEIGLLGKSMNNMSEKLEQNIAELKKANLELKKDIDKKEKLEIMRTDFLSNVSHELKTPLNVVSGYAELMKNGMVQPEDVPAFAGNIYQEAQRLITLVEDIIKVSRLDENTGEFPREQADLHELAELAADCLQSTAEKRHIAITVEGGETTVFGVRQILSEMVFNLCDNAVKYNREGGSVEITTGKRAGHPFLSVKDTGIGIPEAQQNRVFERFYRVDKSHSRNIGGTGLGLSIVKHGAAYHDAEVILNSAEGKGTTITILFPAQ